MCGEEEGEERKKIVRKFWANEFCYLGIGTKNHKMSLKRIIGLMQILKLVLNVMRILRRMVVVII